MANSYNATSAGNAVCIFYDQSAGTYTTRSGGANYDLFPNDFAANDRIEFCLATSGSLNRPWGAGISINVGTALAADAVTGHWEYKNNATGAWIDMSAGGIINDPTNGFTTTGAAVITWKVFDLVGFQRDTAVGGGNCNIRYVIDSVTSPTEGGAVSGTPTIMDGMIRYTDAQTFASLYASDVAGSWGVIEKPYKDTYVIKASMAATGTASLTTSNETIIFATNNKYWGMDLGFVSLTSGTLSGGIGYNGSTFIAQENTANWVNGGVDLGFLLRGTTLNFYGSSFLKGVGAAEFIKPYINYVAATVNWYHSKFYYTWINQGSIPNTTIKGNQYNYSNWERMGNGGIDEITTLEVGMRSWANSPFMIFNSNINGKMVHNSASNIYFVDCVFGTLTNGGQNNSYYYKCYTPLLKVVDKTNTAIVGATLTIVDDSDGSTKATATSNADGVFGVTSGTASAGAARSLTDSSKSWTTNAYQKGVVMITSGTGAGQIKGIVSNTGTVLTIVSPWDTNPSTDSVYVVMPALVTTKTVSSTGATTTYGPFTFQITKAGYQTIDWDSLTITEKIRKVDHPVEMIPALGYGFIQ